MRWEWLSFKEFLGDSLSNSSSRRRYLRRTQHWRRHSSAWPWPCALFTGQKWVEEQPQVEYDQRRPSLFTLTLLSIFVLYVQLILGAMFRHHGLSWWPHVVHAVVVSFVLAWTAIRALTIYSQIEAVRRPAILMLSLVIAQLCLGFTAFLTRVSWGRDAVQPELPMVVATVAHVAVGALLLASTVILSIQVWRHVPVAFEERLPQAQRDASAA